MHVGSTGCPSLCAALIYPGSGFPENPQISVKHNQPPPLPRRAAGAYSVLLHKSHCNLCCVISGFRCLPLSTEGQAIPQIQHGRRVTGSFYSFFCHMWIFFGCFLSHPGLLRVVRFGKSCSSFEIFIWLKMCCTVAAEPFVSFNSSRRGKSQPNRSRASRLQISLR